MVAKKDTYTADSILNPDQHTHLLKRLALTFGGETGDEKHPYSSQKGVAVREVLDNALDEVRAGYGTHVRLSFYKDRSVEVMDSGRGIPVDTSHDGQGRLVSGIYKALGIIQSGGKFTADSDRFSSGLNGVGASSTCHTSARMDVTVYRDGKKHQISFQDGEPGFFERENDPEAPFTALTDLSELRVSPDDRSEDLKRDYPTGTTIRFWLRDTVFQSLYPYDDEDITQRLRGTAFLVPQLYAEVYNELSPVEDPETGELAPHRQMYHFEDGVLDLIALNQPDEALTEVLHFTTEGRYVEKNAAVLQEDGRVVRKDLARRVPIELAFSYGNKYDYSMSSYVNTIHTKLEGEHVVAFERALVKAFNERFRTMRGLLSKNDEEPVIDDYKEGLTAVLSVQVSEPQFTSQSKEQLKGAEVRKAIFDALYQELQNWIKKPENNDALQMIATKVTTAAKNRQKAREQRDLNRKKTELSSAALPEELIDCELSGTEDAELYICEGLSALTSMKGARDGNVNALLPIKGKIINPLKSNPKTVLANKEVETIIKCLGAGVGNDFDIDKMRYGRVFIAVDADPDGNNIACLLYAVFWSLFKDVILQGRLFKLETPLFVVTTHQGKKSRKIYCRDEDERDKVAAELEQQKIRCTISRLKGLGEVNAEDLYITAINPATRVITQVTVDDVEAASDSLELILSPDADNRKVWIEEVARLIGDDDLVEGDE